MAGIKRAGPAAPLNLLTELDVHFPPVTDPDAALQRPERSLRRGQLHNPSSHAPGAQPSCRTPAICGSVVGLVPGFPPIVISCPEERGVDTCHT
ncbi:hypothetical protein [Pseudonocardia sp. MH-G8]|uniref:hypothetical protein n=1 Tax=Pseudonocardia sp. MH-G8 TaxID=1854588 RepID=UPI00117AF376|nr:hypothetical protein [Pseudonocardia sp. MH-G8]